MPDDILLLNQIIAISIKLRDCMSAIRESEYRNTIQEIQWLFNDFIYGYMGNIKLKYGLEKEVIQTQLNIPAKNDAVELVNIVKDLLNNYLNTHNDNTSPEQKAITKSIEDLLSLVMKNIYRLRLAGLERVVTGDVGEVSDKAMPEPEKITNIY